MLVLCSRDPEQIERWRAGLGEHARSCGVCESLEELALPGAASAGDLVLLDAEMAQGDPQRILSLVAAHPSLQFMVFSALHRPEEGAAVIAAGARGYANRYMHPDILEQAVRLVEKGEIWLGADLVLHLIKGGAPRQAVPFGAQSAEQELGKLTARERDIASRIVQGKSNKTIAGELSVAERTVKAHLSSIYRKTGTRDRLQLAMLLRGRI
jgi:DNA-binding NarL/FixJ family response regulator